MRATPPLMATWMLEHWTPGDRNDALAGDLLEEFRSGRSVTWYWRQTVAAIVIGWLTEIVKRRVAVIFSALWSMLAPAWMFYVFRIEAHSNFAGRIWRIDWPWSTILATGLGVAVYLSFIWAGILLYLALQVGITRKIRMKQLGRGLLRSVPVFIVFLALIFALGFLVPAGHAVDRRALTLWSVTTDIRVWSLVARTPCFFAILSGVWGIRLRHRSILDRRI